MSHNNFHQIVQHEKTVVLDIDDTLGNFATPCAIALNRHTGKNISEKDWGKEDIDLCIRYQISHDEFFQLLKRENIIEIMEPIEGASELTHTLHARGYQVVFCTARGWHPTVIETTTSWFKKYDIYYDQVEFVQVGHTKLEKIKLFDNVKIIVDDNVNHIEEMRAAGYHAVLMDQPWNRHFDGPRISKLSEVLDILE